VQKLPSSVTVIFSSPYDFKVLIEVLDVDEKGIVGKYPTNIFIHTEEKDIDNLSLALANETDLFLPSQKDGMMTVPVKVTRIKEYLVANVTFQIDDVNLTTTPIFFHYGMAIGGIITDMQFIDYPEDLFNQGVHLNQTFSVKAKFYDIFGEERPTNYYGFVFFFDYYFKMAGQELINDNFVNFT
jgi:hypothetical protein